jgi:chromosome segregation ATPase
VVSSAEQRAQAAKRTIEETAVKVDSVKSAVDQLSRDVDAQTERVAERGGELSTKLQQLDNAANAAERRGQLYQSRSEELSKRLEAMGRTLENKVQQVSRQVDDISIRRVYPNLGQERFVTYNGERCWVPRTNRQAKSGLTYTFIRWRSGISLPINLRS